MNIYSYVKIILHFLMKNSIKRKCSKKSCTLAAVLTANFKEKSIFVG